MLFIWIKPNFSKKKYIGSNFLREKELVISNMHLGGCVIKEGEAMHLNNNQAKRSKLIIKEMLTIVTELFEDNRGSDILYQDYIGDL